MCLRSFSLPTVLSGLSPALRPCIPTYNWWHTAIEIHLDKDRHWISAGDKLEPNLSSERERWDCQSSRMIIVCAFIDRRQAAFALKLNWRWLVVGAQQVKELLVFPIVILLLIDYNMFCFAPTDRYQLTVAAPLHCCAWKRNSSSDRTSTNSCPIISRHRRRNEAIQLAQNNRRGGG